MHLKVEDEPMNVGGSQAGSRALTGCGEGVGKLWLWDR